MGPNARTRPRISWTHLISLRNIPNKETYIVSHCNRNDRINQGSSAHSNTDGARHVWVAGDLRGIVEHLELIQVFVGKCVYD